MDEFEARLSVVNLFKAPLEDRIARHEFPQDLSHVLLVKHIRDSFVAPLPEAQLLVSTGGRSIVGPRAREDR